MQPDRQRKSTTTGIIAALVGLLLFAWFVRRIGPGEIWGNVRQVGWGLAGICVIAGMRFAARAIAWSLCVEPPHRLPFREAFSAVVSGDAFGNLTPLGPLVGEPAKAAYVRETLPLGPALTALAVENLIYTLSVAAIIAASMIALLFAFDLPQTLEAASEILIGLVLVGLAVAAVIFWRRPALVSGMLERGRSRPTVVARVRGAEHQIYTFAARRPAIVASVAALELLFHALGVLEVHVTWWLMTGTPPAWLTSFVLEGANRLIVVIFKIVPLRLGVDEMGTAAFTQLLGYGPAPGGSLAVVRKVRVVFWIVVGTALLVRRGLTPSRILRDSHAP